MALLAGFSLCWIAEPARSQTQPQNQTQAEPQPQTQSYDLPPAAIGGLIGGAGVYADADYSNTRTAEGFGGRDAAARFAFSANFRYTVASWLRWQISPGFFWVAYDQDSPLPFPDVNNPGDTTKEEVLTLVVPVSAQVQVLHRRGPWLYHVGAGPGVYRVWVENRRKVMKDPFTFVQHKGFYPGVSGQIGVERALKALPATTIEVSTAAHWAFADRPEQFPSGFNSAILGVELRVGANYYFDISRFEKKAGSTAPAVK